MSNRHGFALLAVLWVVIALAALAAGAVNRARADGGASGRSVAWARARWAAEGCLSVAQARVEEEMARGDGLRVTRIDTMAFDDGARCLVATYDPGTRLNTDSASPETRAAFDSALSLPGIDLVSRDTLLTVYGSGRVNINGASGFVLATLPGLGSEARRVLDDARTWHRPVTGLDDLAQRLTPGARQDLLAHYRELNNLTTMGATSLVLCATGWTQGSPAEAQIELEIVDAGGRVAIIKRRMR